MTLITSAMTLPNPPPKLSLVSSSLFAEEKMETQDLPMSNGGRGVQTQVWMAPGPQPQLSVSKIVLIHSSLPA